MSTQTDNGRAFEWAIASALNEQTGALIQESKVSFFAEEAFRAISDTKRDILIRSAAISARYILRKESIVINDGDSAKIVFNKDNAGSLGDPRDILLILNKQVFGVSCKHNHEALKHSRLSQRLDFIKKWGIDSSGCSSQYWQDVKPIFDDLKKIRDQSLRSYKWSDIHDKPNKYYWPLLNAWENEIRRIVCISPEIEAELCKAILMYLVGKYDFYKVICEKSKSVRIQSWNFNNSLSGKRTKYPDCINAINNKNGSQYSKTIIFNHGYSINFRIHNASSKVEPSLKFDIQAIGLPVSEVNQQSFEI